MSRRAALVAIAALAIAAAGCCSSACRAGTRRRRRRPPRRAAPRRRRPPSRKINATLFYVADDGMALVGVEREVPFGEPVASRRAQIVEAQLAPAPRAARLGDSGRARRCAACS